MNGKPWSVATLIQAHRRIALDTNVLIYLLDGHEALGPRAVVVVDAIEAGDVAGYIAAIAQVEILAGAARIGDVAEEAGWLRENAGLAAADAIHIASAKVAGARAMVTNDRRIRPRPGLDIAYLADFELADPAA